MNKKKVLGLVLILAGLMIFFLKPIGNLTGFTIAENLVSLEGIWFYALGLGLIIAGIVLSLGDLQSYSERDSKLIELLGEKYSRLSDKDKIALNKSYRRHLGKEESRDVAKLIEPPRAAESAIIRTRYFDKAIRGHEVEVERAIKKLLEGKGRRERLTHVEGFSLRTTSGGRIIYEQDDEGKYVLKDYTADHHYKD